MFQTLWKRTIQWLFRLLCVAVTTFSMTTNKRSSNWNGRNWLKTARKSCFNETKREREKAADKFIIHRLSASLVCFCSDFFFFYLLLCFFRVPHSSHRHPNSTSRVIPCLVMVCLDEIEAREIERERDRKEKTNMTSKHQNPIASEFDALFAFRIIHIHNTHNITYILVHAFQFLSQNLIRNIYLLL